MKRKIRLTESELTTLIKRMVEQAQEDMGMEYNEKDDMEYGEEQEEMSKSEAVDLIADFFKTELLPNISSEDKSELKHMAREVGPEINEHYLNEDLKSRFKNFKEKTMIGGGISAAVTGMVGFASQVAGWSQTELMSKLHDFFQSFGYAEMTGPLTVAMIAAGLVVALKGYSDRANRLDTPYTKDKRGDGFNSY
jgi:hypothetical protein